MSKVNRVLLVPKEQEMEKFFKELDTQSATIKDRESLELVIRELFRTELKQGNLTPQQVYESWEKRNTNRRLLSRSVRD